MSTLTGEGSSSGVGGSSRSESGRHQLVERV